MAYDQELADRIRLVIGADPALLAVLSEKKMFGGLAFFISGNWIHIRGLEVIGVQVTLKGHTQSICFEKCIL